jgi:thymidylate kinase
MANDKHPHTRLVLFEGIFGSGKTTTAAWLASLLNNVGFEAVHHWESDPKHPIHTGLKIVQSLKTAKHL